MTSGPPPDSRPSPAQPAAGPLRPFEADSGRQDSGTRTAPGARPTVKRGLTSRRAGRVTENDEFAAFARRVIRAWARRVAAGDIDAVADMAAAASELDDAMRDAVNGLRSRGYSWAEVAARLNVTRQAAQQRWGATRRNKADGRAASRP